MINEVEKAKEVDAHILEVSKLVKDKRGYNALINLLTTGVLMNERLGQNDTYEFTKILDKVGVEYRFITNGIELRENAKSNYYNNVIYPKNREVPRVSNYNQNVNRIGKDEKGSGWIRTLKKD